MILPEELVAHFEVVKIEQVENKLEKCMEFEISLEEKNIVPKNYNTDEYESKGFMPKGRVQDFPIRGKACYLIIKKRRWRHKETKKEISNDFSFIADGARLTAELADFLKSTGRDPRRYH